MVEQAGDRVGLLRRIERLDGETHPLAHDLLRAAVHPGDLHAQTPPVFGEPPEMRRQPCDARLREHDSEVRELPEDALGNQAGERSLEGGRLRGVVLGEVGGPADRRRRVPVGGAGVEGDRQARALGGGVDRPVDAPAGRRLTHHRQQHLHEAPVLRRAFDLLRRKLRGVGRHEDGGAQARVAVQPLGPEPVVQRTGEAGRHVLGIEHRRAVEAVENGKARAEPVHRVAQQAGGVAAGPPVAVAPVRPAGERRIRRPGDGLQLVQPPMPRRIRPVRLQVRQQRRDRRRRRMQVAVYRAGGQGGHSAAAP